MRKLSIEEAKQIELDILAYIDSFCKKHNINYFIKKKRGGNTIRD